MAAAVRTDTIQSSCSATRRPDSALDQPARGGRWRTTRSPPASVGQRAGRQASGRAARWADAAGRSRTSCPRACADSPPSRDVARGAGPGASGHRRGPRVRSSRGALRSPPRALPSDPRRGVPSGWSATSSSRFGGEGWRLLASGRTVGEPVSLSGFSGPPRPGSGSGPIYAPPRASPARLRHDAGRRSQRLAARAGGIALRASSAPSDLIPDLEPDLRRDRVRARLRRDGVQLPNRLSYVEDRFFQVAEDLCWAAIRASAPVFTSAPEQMVQPGSASPVPRVPRAGGRQTKN